eukprot:scaffold360394_cov60-Cyclotella_meneghiniana.AAC.1
MRGSHMLLQLCLGWLCFGYLVGADRSGRTRRRSPKSSKAAARPNFILIRNEEAVYADGISSMDLERPNARDVSNAFASSLFKPNSFGATDMLWAFGQFINHDISETIAKPGDLCNIPVGKDDPLIDDDIEFIPMNRSSAILDSIIGPGVAQQISMLSPFVDAESLYGNTKTRLKFIRSKNSDDTGRLRTSGPNLLPKNTEGLSNRGGDDRADLFLAGDTRANENVGLLVSHTLWMREHNHWADQLQKSDPKLSGDDIFSMARVIVQAEMQKIVYDEFLPALLGNDAIPPYRGFDPNVDPRVENIVSSCALRIGHTMVGPSLLLDYGKGNHEEISIATWFAPIEIERVGGIDAFLRGMANNVCQEVDPFLTPAMRNEMFNGQIDLLAINIERARDHGMPDFNTIRESL